MTTERTFAALGALLGLFAVGLGAMAAHALEARFSTEQAEWWDTAARYQLSHALALFAAAWAAWRWPGGPAAWAGWLFLAGVLIFCGTLYLMALGGPRWLGAVTPIGGVALMAGWAALAWAALRG